MRSSSVLLKPNFKIKAYPGLSNSKNNYSINKSNKKISYLNRSIDLMPNKLFDKNKSLNKNKKSL